MNEPDLKPGSNSGIALVPPRIDNFCSPANAPFYDAQHYKLLDNSRKEIRLVQVHPGNPGDPVRCTIVQNFSLLEESRAAYQTISYTAGDPTVTVPILVNEIPFNAFFGVGQMLITIRRHYQNCIALGKDVLPPLIWIDQICINQSDHIERAHQVSSMRDIYKGAYQLFIWLGGKQDEPGAGLPFLTQLTDLAISTCGTEPDGPNLDSSLMDDLIQDIAKECIGSGLEGFMTGWAGLRQILKSPWWSRCWIVQELLSSTSRLLIYGKSCISWEIFGAGLLVARGVYDALSKDFDQSLGSSSKEAYIPLIEEFHTAPAFILVELDRDWSSKPDRDLKDVLNRLRNFQSTDPRDRIYAILGLVHSDYSIVPDYSESNTMLDVLMNTVEGILEVDRDLELLRFVESPSTLRYHSLPSWVPQWTPSLDDDGLALRDGILLTVKLKAWSNEQYRASGAFRTPITLRKHSTPPEYELLVKGILLGPVAKIDSLEDWDFKRAPNFCKSAA